MELFFIWKEWQIERADGHGRKIKFWVITKGCWEVELNKIGFSMDACVGKCLVFDHGKEGNEETNSFSVANV